MEAPPSQSTPMRLFTVAAILSLGQNLLMTGVFFYTQSRLGWGVMANLLLAAGQGVFYTVGALLAHRVAARFQRRGAMIALLFLSAVVAGGAMVQRNSAWLALWVLIYTILMAMAWPMMESLVSHGLDARALSRRIGVYNLVWASVGVLAIAIEGTIIDYFPIGVCLLPLIVGLICAALMWGHVEPSQSSTSHGRLEPEADLLRDRRLALWLSRVALPATYIVEFSFMAMLPSLPALGSLSTSVQTLVGSVWTVGRLLAFALLLTATWWHTRPRVMLTAAVVMGVAFLGVTVRPSDLFGISTGLDITSMIFWQLVLGATFGLIYCASLYFGMVLSQGSTEHGGYHEALIGLGQILGPGCAAGAAALWPGRLTAGVVAVSVMIALSIAAAGGVTVSAQLRDTRER